MDSDVFWDVYREDIKSWDVKRIIHELDLTRKDFNEGMLDKEGYTKATQLLESELEQKLHKAETLSPSEAYDRAMQGI